MADLEQQLNQLSNKLDAEHQELSNKLDTKHSENIARLINLEVNSKQLTSYVDDLHKALFGNGQPGIIAGMNARITNLEKWVWRALGAGFVLMNLILTASQFLRK